MPKMQAKGVHRPNDSYTPKTPATKAWESAANPQSPDLQHSEAVSIPPLPLSKTLTSRPRGILTFVESMPALTRGNRGGKIIAEDNSKMGIGGWFTGSAAPVTNGVPGETEEEEEEAGAISTAMPPIAKTTSQSSSFSAMKWSTNTMSSAARTAQPTQSPSPSRFVFFSKTSTPTVVQVPANLDDEFLNLDITSALFPNGSPADPFSPSSFKNLLSNAENLLSKLQTAYKLRTLAVHELTKEKEAQADELCEAETRAAHLKIQLEDMGKKLLQQDHDILTISNELAAERQRRAEEREAHQESLQILRARAYSPEIQPLKANDSSLVSRGSRTSFDSYNLDDNESVFSQSIFSHSRSHTSTSSAGTGITTPDLIGSDSDDHNITPKASRANTATAPQRTSIQSKTDMPPLLTPQQSVFAKILGGGTVSAPHRTITNLKESSGLGISEMGCPNCRGGSSSVAWDAVGLLREENRHLKETVTVLDEGVDAALGLIVGSWREDRL